MDKKNTIIGVALLIAAVGLMITAKKPTPQQQAPTPSEQTNYDPSEPRTNESIAPLPAAPGSVPAVASGHAHLELNEERIGEVIESLENDFMEVRFTNFGGAIKEVELKNTKKTIDSDENYVMNHLRFEPALNLTTYIGNAKDVEFTLIPDNDPNKVTYGARLSEQLEVTRTYTISQSDKGADPYMIFHTLEYRNLSDQALPMSESYLNIGTVAPSGNQDRFLQTFGYNDGEDIEFIKQSDFQGGGIPFFKKAPKDVDAANINIVWASVKNQFFITILTPEIPGVGYVTRPVDFPAEKVGEKLKTGLTGSLKIAGFTLEANATETQNYSFYAGPKKHGLIAKLKQKQEQAMQFGFFGKISKFLLVIMNGIYGFVGNWGVSIILLTLLIRGVLLPITLMSMKSMKKMSKIQEPMKKLKEKYPDDMQKQQQMMMELYRANKINPVAGCLPMVAQIPIFFALFYMLRSAAELRFADFLWISDLSKPDTLFVIPNMPFFGDLPINALPFVWIVTLAYQMWTMPTPTVDNAQAKMMKFMPFVFFPFTYTFASGLVLYWSVSNVFTIGQQWLVKRGGDEFELQLPPAFKKALEADSKKKRRKK